MIKILFGLREIDLNSLGKKWWTIDLIIIVVCCLVDGFLFVWSEYENKLSSEYLNVTKHRLKCIKDIFQSSDDNNSFFFLEFMLL